MSLKGLKTFSGGKSSNLSHPVFNGWNARIANLKKYFQNTKSFEKFLLYLKMAFLGVSQSDKVPV